RAPDPPGHRQPPRLLARDGQPDHEGPGERPLAAQRGRPDGTAPALAEPLVAARRFTRTLRAAVRPTRRRAAIRSRAARRRRPPAARAGSPAGAAATCPATP